MIYLGVDPGQKGGISCIDNNEVFALPYTDDNLLSVCKSVQDKECLCIVEKVGAMPKQGVVSMFNFGKSVGYIYGVLESYKIPYRTVLPQKWKAEFNLNKKDKSESIKTCKRLFPKVNLFPTERCRKENDGMAESLLMAYYGKVTSNE